MSYFVTQVNGKIRQDLVSNRILKSFIEMKWMNTVSMQRPQRDILNGNSVESNKLMGTKSAQMTPKSNENPSKV